VRTYIAKTGRQAAKIDALPDNVLLEVFDFCRRYHYDLPALPISGWNKLVHVCHKWRQIIFASSRRLNLELLCTIGTPVRTNLGYWPAFPIVVDYFVRNDDDSGDDAASNDEDDIIAALEHRDRVRRIEIIVTASLLGKLATIMQEPFTELTYLRLSSSSSSSKGGGVLPILRLPSGFLCGSAPHVQHISLDGISFPELPTLLSSASNLRSLKLDKIPQTGYISPEAMVDGLAALTMLTTLSLRFQSPASRPTQRRPPPRARIALPSLTFFEFHGVSEYLEDLVAHIDAPRLASSNITYFNQLVFQTPQLGQWLSRAENLQVAPFESAYLGCGFNKVDVQLRSSRVQSYLLLRVLCRNLDWQVYAIAQLLGQSVHLLSGVHHLSVGEAALRPGWREHMHHADWLELFRPFVAVRTLRVCWQLAGHVAFALDDIAQAAAAVVVAGEEVLPCLHALYLEDQPATAVERFAALRRRCGRPVTILGNPDDFFRAQLER